MPKKPYTHPTLMSTADHAAQMQALTRTRDQANGPSPFTCPNCGESDQIDIDATVRVRIVQDPVTGEIGTDADASEDGSHKWTDRSGAYCAHCGYSGIVEDFDTEDPDEDDDGPPQTCECGRTWEAGTAPEVCECGRPLSQDDDGPAATQEAQPCN